MLLGKRYSSWMQVLGIENVVELFITPKRRNINNNTTRLMGLLDSCVVCLEVDCTSWARKCRFGTRLLAGGKQLQLSVWPFLEGSTGRRVVWLNNIIFVVEQTVKIDFLPVRADVAKQFRQC